MLCVPRLPPRPEARGVDAYYPSIPTFNYDAVAASKLTGKFYFQVKVEARYLQTKCTLNSIVRMSRWGGRVDLGTSSQVIVSERGTV